MHGSRFFRDAKPKKTKNNSHGAVLQTAVAACQELDPTGKDFLNLLHARSSDRVEPLPWFWLSALELRFAGRPGYAGCFCCCEGMLGVASADISCKCQVLPDSGLLVEICVCGHVTL